VQFRSDKENIIVTMTFELALQIITYTTELENERKFNMANQLLRCGTSIGANVHEAQNAESKADFIHKMKIAAKEADETLYWLNLCETANSYYSPSNEPKINLESIIKILSKIIGTSKRNKQNNIQ
jgi:four helix bundle protein